MRHVYLIMWCQKYQTLLILYTKIGALKEHVFIIRKKKLVDGYFNRTSLITSWIFLRFSFSDEFVNFFQGNFLRLGVNSRPFEGNYVWFFISREFLAHAWPLCDILRKGTSASAAPLGATSKPSDRLKGPSQSVNWKISHENSPPISHVQRRAKSRARISAGQNANRAPVNLARYANLAFSAGILYLVKIFGRLFRSCLFIPGCKNSGKTSSIINPELMTRFHTRARFCV